MTRAVPKMSEEDIDFVERKVLTAAESRALYTSQSVYRLPNDQYPWEMTLRSNLPTLFGDTALNVIWLQENVARVHANGIYKVVKLLPVSKWAEAEVCRRLTDLPNPPSGFITGLWSYWPTAWTDNVFNVSDRNFDILLMCDDAGISLKTLISSHGGPLPSLTQIITSLDDILQGMAKIDPNTVVIAKATDYRFIHGDIQLKNIAFDHVSGKIRILDYGLCWLETVEGTLTPRIRRLQQQCSCIPDHPGHHHHGQIINILNMPQNGTEDVQALLRCFHCLVSSRLIQSAEEQDEDAERDLTGLEAWLHLFKSGPIIPSLLQTYLRSSFSHYFQ